MKHEIFRPSTRQDRSDTAASVRHFMQANKDVCGTQHICWEAARPRKLSGNWSTISTSQAPFPVRPGSVSKLCWHC